ncbi:ATP-grasp domain-containing protein [Metabacillus niabensis]|uniref:Biotin carboxylase n=1 Tax=Metabacillus niabensis TaxID=324854 RepID=A0ABT9Z4D6_9BACI|nr:ATP-grasp domain-containing protein [Metabacillus niabensis]MDQ0227131.1 biotin carboxylase [Metabacillus niabensis]
MSQKKILMLGGSNAQVPAIKYAKAAGHHVITCDFLPDNPGHVYADEYYNISTINKEEVLTLAEKLEIDGIVAYASDPSAPTAAFVSEKLGLPGASYDSVKTLAEKDLFRTFLQKHHFNCPKFISVETLDYLKEYEELNYPCFVKPVDSSGSKGITKVNSPKGIKEALEIAFSYSRVNRAIIEEYIDSPYNQLHGDGFVYNGELGFLGICDQYFKNNVPLFSKYPSSIGEELIEKVTTEISRLIKLVNYKNGAINVEVRVGDNQKIYILEIGPRSGGNYIPQLMQNSTGFNEIEAIIETAVGNHLDFTFNKKKEYCLQYIIGANESGDFAGLSISDFLKERIRQLYIHKKIGEHIDSYENSSNVLGVAIANFKNDEELLDVAKNIHSHIKVNVN